MIVGGQMTNIPTIQTLSAGIADAASMQSHTNQGVIRQNVQNAEARM